MLKRLLVNSYTELFVPYSDEKVAAALCKGGNVKYALKGGSGLSDDWILENDVPNIVKVCGKEVSFLSIITTVVCFP